VQVGSRNVQINNYFFGSPASASGSVPVMPVSRTAGSSQQGHAFISYVREDSAAVDELQHLLEAAGIPVWRDTDSLWPGEDWRAKVRDAITRDALVFIACFSSHSAARRKTYMNEELRLAIEQLRQRQPHDPWLIPVRFDDCVVPDLELGPGRTLGSLHRADLFGDRRDEAGWRLVGAVQRLLGESALQPPGKRIVEPPFAAALTASGAGPLQGDEADQASPASETALRISLLGAPASGKTTFLAALRHAVSRVGSESGLWNVFPANAESSRVIVEFTDALLRGQFPGSTPLNTTTTLQWLFVGDIAGTKFDHRKFRRGSLQRRFLLDLVDVNGAAFADDAIRTNAHQNIATRALDHLASAAGIIYLFDPISERQEGNSAHYVNGVLAELQRRYAALGHWRRYLPQHVAVCITKFDDSEIFQRARLHGFVSDGPDGIPRVRDRDAEQFFDALCSGTFWGERDRTGRSSARFVQHQLRNAFDPRNIRYYVTSSIGFYQPPAWSTSDTIAAFNPNDFVNYDEKMAGNRGIRGSVRPINVLEPLIGLMGHIENGLL
jgi:hypothetical protein